MDKFKIFEFKGSQAKCIHDPLLVFPELSFAKQFVTTKTKFKKEVIVQPSSGSYISIFSGSAEVAFFVEE